MDRVTSKLTSKTIPGAATLVVAFILATGSGPQAVAAQEPGQPLEPVRVDTVLVEGTERVAPEVVLSAAAIQMGDRITFREVQEAIRRLWATGEFADVAVHAREVDPADPASGVRLVIRVEERPYVSAVEFRGLETLRPRTVRDSVGLSAGQAYDPARAAEAESLMREMLAERGIRLRSVAHRLDPVAEAPGEYRLVFDVVEGERVAIASVVFHGNEAFRDKELERAIETRSEGFLWFRPGLFDEATFRADLRQTLPEFYSRHGFIDFAVLGDTLIVDPATGKARVEIQVSEGPQYRLVEFDIRGNRNFPTDELRRYYESGRAGLLGAFGLGIGGEEGQLAEQTPVFNRARFDQATEDVNQVYRNHGFLYAQVAPFVERTQTETGEPGVRVGWEIVERDPAYVHRVHIVGNTFTHENVIRDRIFVLPGDVYSEELLIQSYRSIMGLGFFESPLPMPRMEEVNDGDIDVVFEVEEKQTGSINFGTTIGGWGGIAGFLGYDQPNLFGQAKAGNLRWEFGQRYNNFQLGYSDPSIRGSQVSGSLQVFSSKENRFFNFPEGERRRTGSAVRFGLPFPLDRQSTRVFVGYQLSRTAYRDFGSEGSDIFGLPPGFLSTASLSLMRNTLDHPLFPTVGTRHEVRGEFSGGLLGGDGDFNKYVARGSWWVPVGQFGGQQVGARPVRMALGLTAETGVIVGDASGFPFERFWMGGVQFGENLRGYDETTITPMGYLSKGRGTLSDRLGNAFVRLSAEYAVRFTDAVSISVFGDAGNLWRDALEVNPNRLFRGAGIGVDLVTPFGPMGLDYAYGFDRAEPGWQLHFKFGQGF
jgi:outer membrane protein insertion porin family